jgi:hypothetical protein
MRTSILLLLGSLALVAQEAAPGWLPAGGAVIAGTVTANEAAASGARVTVGGVRVLAGQPAQSLVIAMSTIPGAFSIDTVAQLKPGTPVLAIVVRADGDWSIANRRSLPAGMLPLAMPTAIDPAILAAERAIALGDESDRNRQAQLFGTLLREVGGEDFAISLAIGIVSRESDRDLAYADTLAAQMRVYATGLSASTRLACDQLLVRLQPNYGASDERLDVLADALKAASTEQQRSMVLARIHQVGDECAERQTADRARAERIATLLKQGGPSP